MSIERSELEQTQQGNELEADASAKNAILPLICTPLFGALAVFGWRSHSYSIAIFCGFLGLMMVLALIDFFQLTSYSGPTFRIDSRGIEYANYGLIPWQEVIGLQLVQVQMNYSRLSTLYLGVRKPLRYLENLNFIARRTAQHRLEKNPDYGYLAIQLNRLNKDAKSIFDAALAQRGKNSAPLLEHWNYQMDAVQVESLLRMQALNDEIQHMTEEFHSIPNPTDAQLAAFNVRFNEYIVRRETAQPEFEAAMDKSVQQAKQQRRTTYWVLGIMLLLFVARIWLAWHK